MTTPRCRPGDLAVVVRPNIPANLGRIVRVIRPYGASPDLRMRSASCIWLIEGAQPLTWSNGGGSHHGRRGPAPDEALYPIRGASETATRRQLRPAE
jgi:hypothetical protein